MLVHFIYVFLSTNRKWKDILGLRHIARFCMFTFFSPMGSTLFAYLTNLTRLQCFFVLLNSSSQHCKANQTTHPICSIQMWIYLYCWYSASSPSSMLLFDRYPAPTAVISHMHHASQSLSHPHSVVLVIWQNLLFLVCKRFCVAF